MAVKSIYNNSIWEFRPKAVTVDTATTVLDLSDSQHFQLTLETDTLLQLDNPLKGVYLLVVNNNGNHHLSFPSNVYFPDGVAPPVSTREGASDLFTLVYDGTNFYASSSTELVHTGLLDRFPGAAAYSLRNLSYDSIGNPVIRIRRSSDNAETDFTAAEILNGTAEAWVNEEYVVYTSDFTLGNEGLVESNGTGTDGETIAGVSDAYKFTLSGGSGVHSARLTPPMTIGQQYRVDFDYYIPSSNSITTRIRIFDINPATSFSVVDSWTSTSLVFENQANNYLRFIAADNTDFVTLNADGDVFYLKNIVVTQTTADGFVVTWYDQSGNSNDATQSTASQQPQIVSGGSLITSNGYNVIQYDGSNDNLGIASLTATGTMLMAGSDGSAFYEVDINGAYNLIPDANNTDHPLNETIRIIWNRTLSTAEKTAIQTIVNYTDWDFSDITSFVRYWQSRSEFTSFPLIHTSSATSFAFAWYGCTSLTSFPLIDTSSGTSFAYAWFLCNSLTSFPLINTSSGTNFGFAWFGCSSLTSFPLINTSSGTSFQAAWSGCSSLTSFPLVDTSSGTDFTEAWYNCSSLTSFPLVDTSSATSLGGAWRNCTSLTSFPLINTSSVTNFALAWRNCSSFTTFPLINTSSGTSFIQAWRFCTSLTSFPLIDTSSGTSFSGAWRDCTSLISFPLINTSSGTNFTEAWLGCSSLTTFPLIDTSSGTNFTEAWLNCISLTSFPLIDTSSGTNFTSAWNRCLSLTSFPLINTSSGTNFQAAWRNCSSLTTIPANMFDSCPATNFTLAFTNTILSSQSIENIVVSIDTAGQSNGTLDITGGGNATTATAQTAIDNLRAKGWTVTVPDGY